MNRICVIIPQYGKEEYTRKCIELTDENSGVPVDILVVDDGSVDKFHDYRVNILRLDKNSGFTNAVNQGILWCGDRYEYIHLLNNDTEPKQGFIKFLLDEIEKDEDIAVASSIRLYIKNGSFDVELYGIDLIRGYQAVTKIENLKDEVIECNWVPLCSSLIRTSIIREIGLLDKQMRNHSSDLDYCLRVKMAYYRIIVVTDSRVIHHHEVTTKSNNITPNQDQRALLEKLAGLGYAQIMKVMPLDAESKTFGKLDFTVYKK